MTRARAWDQAEKEFLQDGERRFVHRRTERPDPDYPWPNYLITKYYSNRRKWTRIGSFDGGGKHDQEAP